MDENRDNIIDEEDENEVVLEINRELSQEISPNLIPEELNLNINTLRNINRELNNHNILLRYQTILRNNDISQNINFNPNLNISTTNTLNRILQASFYDKSKYKQILSEKGEKELEKIRYNTNLDTNNICPIFQIEFKDNMEIIKLPCNHSFIPEAIYKWLKEENAICPVCRYNLDSKEVKDKQENSSLNRMETENFFQSLRRTYQPVGDLYLNTIISGTGIQVSPIDREIETITPLLNNTTEGEESHTTNEEITSQRLNITNNFLNDIMNQLISNQDEEDLQQAILNSLTSPNISTN